jgi:hypothetical protein
MSRETRAEEVFRAMSSETALRTLLRFHAALHDLGYWREVCAAYDEDVGNPPRDPDGEMVEAMESRARAALAGMPKDASE